MDVEKSNCIKVCKEFVQYGICEAGSECKSKHPQSDGTLHVYGPTVEKYVNLRYLVKLKRKELRLFLLKKYFSKISDENRMHVYHNEVELFKECGYLPLDVWKDGISRRPLSFTNLLEVLESKPVCLTYLIKGWCRDGIYVCNKGRHIDQVELAEELHKGFKDNLADTNEMFVRMCTPRRLHVSNLPFKVRDIDLGALFVNFGPILDAEIIYNWRGSKGFGFITLANCCEAERAKRILNGAFIDGRFLEVNNAIISDSLVSQFTGLFGSPKPIPNCKSVPDDFCFDKMHPGFKRMIENIIMGWKEEYKTRN